MAGCNVCNWQWCRYGSRTVELAVSEVDRSRSPQGQEVIYYCATTDLDRFEFGIRYGPGIIGRSLKVTINVQASQSSEPPA